MRLSKRLSAVTFCAGIFFCLVVFFFIKTRDNLVSQLLFTATENDEASPEEVAFQTESEAKAQEEAVANANYEREWAIVRRDAAKMQAEKDEKMRIKLAKVVLAEKRRLAREEKLAKDNLHADTGKLKTEKSTDSGGHEFLDTTSTIGTVAKTDVLPKKEFPAQMSELPKEEEPVELGNSENKHEVVVSDTTENPGSKTPQDGKERPDIVEELETEQESKAVVDWDTIGEPKEEHMNQLAQSPELSPNKQKKRKTDTKPPLGFHWGAPGRRTVKRTPETSRGSND